MAKKPLEIDMIAGSQLRDTQGEMLSVEGADISDLQAGKGRFNDNHGKGFFNSIGRVTKAKKIFKEEDCENDRHKYYWDKVKAPFIYVAGHLYNNEDHPNAKAAAAILRNIHKNDIPLKLKASVEGGVISRGIKDASLLARTKIHSVALTFTPANNATLVEPTSLDKSADEAADMELIKSVMHLVQTNIPSFRHITRDAQAAKVQNNLQQIADLFGNQVAVPSKGAIIDDAIQAKVAANVKKINEMTKALTAGYGGAGAPTSMVGGSVMQTESLDDGRPKFKHVSCDKCGKEQIYAKHQVKCRECGQNWSLEKLYGAVKGSKGS
jgi:ribosomal protein L37E